jgi:hypothetical protein
MASSLDTMKTEILIHSVSDVPFCSLWFFCMVGVDWRVCVDQWMLEDRFQAPKVASVVRASSCVV